MYIKDNKIFKNNFNKMNRNYTYQLQYKSILGNKKNLCSFQNGLDVLRLINIIKKDS